MATANTNDESGLAKAGEASYHPDAARGFFQLAGRQEPFAAGATVYAEDRRPGAELPKGSRMYLLLSGRVVLTQNGQPLELVMPGEVFGATAFIGGGPRNTTAMAQKDSVAIAIDDAQFLPSLQRMPEASLMLIEAMAQRLQRYSGRLAKQAVPAAAPLVSQGAVSQAGLDELRHRLHDPVPTRIEAGGTIIAEGAMAIFMYALIEGRVAISVGGRVVEYVGPGTVFGELALVGGTNRAATVVAEEACAWYPVGRKELVGIVEANPLLGVALLRSLGRRIRHLGAVLSADAATLAAMKPPLLDTAGAPGGFSLRKLMYKRHLGSFAAAAGKSLAAATAAVAGGNTDAALAAAKTLKTLADDVGAQRVAHHAQTLCIACAAVNLDALPALLARARSEVEATAAEIRNFLGK